ncbi:MAG: hypothetical protein V3W32_05825 [Gemmatimonadota bacterium]
MKTRAPGNHHGPILRRLTAVVIALALGCACSSTPLTRATGDSSGTVLVGTPRTTTTDPRTGVVTVQDECLKCEEETSVANPGSEQLYKLLLQGFTGMIGLAALLAQLL